MINRDFSPGEKNVMKYILADGYKRMAFDKDKERYIDKKSEIEVTIEEYVNLQNVLEKLGVTIY